MWKSTSELGYRRRKHGDEVASMAWDVRRVDGVGRPKFDFHTGWAEGGVYRKSIEDGPMRAALERLWALQRDRADEHFAALVAADIAADGDGKWWLRHEKRYGPSRFVGVTMQSGRWKVMLTVDGKLVHVGMCDNEEDAARLVDLLLVRVRREAPRNFPKAFGEFFETGCDGDVPAELVAAAKEALRRVGHVEVKGAESVEVAEARAAASSVEAKIAAAVAKPENHSRASMPLSDAGYDSGLGTWDKSLKTKWNAEQGRHMEAKGVKTVRNLALVNMDNMKLLLTLALCDDTASGRLTARRKLWNWKGAAAALVGVDDIGKLPKQSIVKNGRPPKQELTTKEQDALDVAMRWAASRAGTVDEELATKYAEALADIARRQLSKEGSGGDDGAEPPQKKKKRRR